MRNVLLASIALATATLASGCLGCGGFSGAGDRVYQRGTESMILCENGGFVANTTTDPIEGRYQQDTGGNWFATRGESGDLATDLTFDADGSVETPQLGATAWTEVQLDQTALDHADVQCSDLTTRAWWTAQ
jgi:hypothetical protein